MAITSQQRIGNSHSILALYHLFSDHVVRTANENARTLRFMAQGFETE